MNKQEPTLYKNVKMSIDQYTMVIVSLNKYIKTMEENVEFFTEKLNSSSSTQEVREYQDYIKLSKENIKHSQSTLDEIEKSELITEHKLY